jgi:hypothetical protein
VEQAVKAEEFEPAVVVNVFELIHGGLAEQLGGATRADASSFEVSVCSLDTLKIRHYQPGCRFCGAEPGQSTNRNQTSQQERRSRLRAETMTAE